LAVKEKYKLADYKEKLNQLSNDVFEKHQQFAKQVSEKSVTVLKGELNVTREKTLVISPVPMSLNDADGQVYKCSFAEVLADKLGCDAHVSHLNVTDEDINDIVLKAASYHQVIVGTYNVASFETQANLVNALCESHPNLIAVALRNPYDIKFYPQVKTAITAYEYSKLSIESLVNAMVNGVSGQAVCPVKLELN
ncbi:MAG: hypothetical protein ACRCS6_10645, partial [Turicibacter sp.]